MKELWNDNFVKSIWRIGTSVDTYINNSVLKWIENDDFIYNMENLKISKDNKFSDNKFLLGGKEENVDIEIYKGKKSTPTLKQVCQVLTISGVLVENGKDYILNHSFIDFVKSNSEKEEVYKFIGKEVYKRASQYIDLLNKFNNSIRNDEEKIDFLSFIQSEDPHFHKIVEISKENWINSILVGYSSVSFDSYDLSELFRKHIDSKDTESSYWNSFSFNIFKYSNKEKEVDSLLRKLKDILQLEQAELYNHYLHEQYSIDDINNINHLHINDSKLNLPLTPFQSRVTNLIDYFSWLLKDGYKFEIPLFQRNYTWDEYLVTTLLKCVNQLGSDDTKHFLGSISYSTNASLGDGSFLLKVVDGQQRTTTLFLLFYALYKMILYENSNNNKVEMPEIFIKMFLKKNQNSILWFENKDYLESESYCNLGTLFLKSPNEVLDVFKNKSNPFSKKVKDNLDLIWNWLFNKFSNISDKDKRKEAIENFTRNLLERVYVNILTIPVESEDKIFENMNLYSKKLSNLDLLNSYVYKICQKNKNLLDRFKQEFSNKFYKKDKELIEDSKKLDLFVDFLLFKENKKYDTYINKEYYPFHQINEYIDEKIKSNVNIVEILEHLYKDLKIFDYISDYSKDDKNNINEVDKFLKEFENREILKSILPFLSLTNVYKDTVLLPLVLSILEKFKIFNGKIDDKEHLKVINEIMQWLFEIERFHLFWKTAYFEGQSMRRIIKSWASEVLNQSVINSKELREKYEGWFKEQHNVEVEEHFIEWLNKNYYYNVSSEKNYNKIYISLLKRVEWYLHNELNNFPDLKYYDKLNSYINMFNKISWEHFYPKKISKNNINAQIEDLNKKHGIINFIGNGFILNINGNKQLNNKPTKEKFKEYVISEPSNKFTFYGVNKDEVEKWASKYQHKNQNIKRYVKNTRREYEYDKLFEIKENWNEQDIIQRTIQLLCIIKDIYTNVDDKNFEEKIK